MLKSLSVIVAASLLVVLTSSCASLTVMARAEGIPAPLDDEATFVSQGPQPAYYALLPAVFPFDLVTFPGQFIYFKMNERELSR